VITQLREQHAGQMKRRPEVGPGEFKTLTNRAGQTEFVAARVVSGTLAEGSRLLPSLPPDTTKSLMTIFIVAEILPFCDGNGSLARLAMNAELAVVQGSNSIVSMMFREEHLDCLRVGTR
jgi:hypothetical protein